MCVCVTGLTQGRGVCVCVCDWIDTRPRRVCVCVCVCVCVTGLTEDRGDAQSTNRMYHTRSTMPVVSSKLDNSET